MWLINIVVAYWETGIKAEEPNRIYKCLPSDGYAQLKLYAYELISVCGNAYHVKGHFKRGSGQNLIIDQW